MKHSLSLGQLFFLVANFSIGSSLLLAPIITGATSKENAWLSMLMAIVVGFLLQLLLLVVMRKRNYESIFSIVDQAYGKWIGTLINVLILIFIFHLCALVVGNTDDFMVVIKPDTSATVYQVTMIGLAMYCALHGLGNLNTTNQALSIVFYFIFIFSIIMLIPQIDVNNFKPFLYEGWKPVIEGGYNSLGVPFLELTLITGLLTYVNQKQHIRRYYLLGLLFGGGVLFFFVAASIGVEGAYLTQRESYPTYSLMRDIHVTKVFERIEIIIGIAWIFVLFVKITTLFILLLLGVQHIAKADDYKTFILPLSLAIWCLTNLSHENLIENASFTSKNWTLYSFTLYLLILLSIIIAGLRNKPTN